MAYKLNNVNFSDFNIQPGQAPGSNIAITGIFDLPKRIGDTHRLWDDDNSVEPYVDADEIYLGGRELNFYGFIIGGRADINYDIENFKNLIKSFDDLVIFSSDYGDFNVKVINGDLTHKKGFAILRLIMREPAPDLTGGVLPAVSYSNYMADSRPLSSFGLTVLKISGRGDLPEFKDEHFITDKAEGYQVTGRQPTNITIKALLKANDLISFQNHIKALWKLFTDPGLRKLSLNDYMTIESFVVDGFKVTGVSKRDKIVATVQVEFIATNQYIKVYSPSEIGSKILITELGKIIVYG